MIFSVRGMRVFAYGDQWVSGPWWQWLTCKEYASAMLEMWPAVWMDLPAWENAPPSVSPRSESRRNRLTTCSGHGKRAVAVIGPSEQYCCLSNPDSQYFNLPEWPAEGIWAAVGTSTSCLGRRMGPRMQFLRCGQTRTSPRCNTLQRGHLFLHQPCCTKIMLFAKIVWQQHVLSAFFCVHWSTIIGALARNLFGSGLSYRKCRDCNYLRKYLAAVLGPIDLLNDL